MGVTESTKKRYAAFISYAHADEAMAARLHKALETYPVPKHLRAQGKTTKPIFRDVAELTAAHSLSEKIQEAVKGSRVLIVLCSPAAKASHWVNEEIRLFRSLHGDAAILSALIEGTPQSAFPDALVEGGREPLAAALGSDKAGFRLGVTQLAAGLLGTGLDDLVQRAVKRRNRILGAGLAASFLFSAAMGFTAYQAIDARNEAQTARGEAEGLIEYMIKDLKFKLEPVGRLDLLEGIGDKAVEYYNKQDIKQLSDDSLTRQAAARQVLAQVHLDAGRMEEAQKEIEASAALTREVLVRNPDDDEAIFAHAQSEYWVGSYYFRQGKFSEMEKPWREYNRLAQVLYQKDPKNFKWVMEAGWGQNNLGILARSSNELKYAEAAKENYLSAIAYFNEALVLLPDSAMAMNELANTLAGLAFSELGIGSAEVARKLKDEEFSLRNKMLKRDPANQVLRTDNLSTRADYLNRYFLKQGSDQMLEMQTLLDAYFEISISDKDNAQNALSFVRIAIENSESLSLERLVERRNKIERVLQMIALNGVKISLDRQLSIELFNARIEYLRGNVAVAEKLIQAVNEKLSALDTNENSYSPTYLTAFYRNQDIGQFSYAKAHAERYLQIVNSNYGELRYPTTSRDKIILYKYLELCDEIKPLANDLLARDFISKVEHQEMFCAEKQ